MSQFDARWEVCVQRGRRESVRDEAAPFGFATRVLSALAARRANEAASLDLIWHRLTLRSLRWIGAVLLVCAVFELPHWHERRVLDPGIENTVAQLVWSL
jgi:hypothetical protein